MLKLIKRDVPVSFGSYKTVGAILHDPQRQVLMLDDPEEPDQIISVRLDAYGLVPNDDNTTVFIKDWSENTGLTASLVVAGAVEIVREVIVGPHYVRAYEVRILESEPVGAASITAGA
jgi:ABC-type antimicrobial peptide transport system ATPase subunit